MTGLRRETRDALRPLEDHPQPAFALGRVEDEIAGRQGDPALPRLVPTKVDRFRAEVLDQLTPERSLASGGIRGYGTAPGESLSLPGERPTRS